MTHKIRGVDVEKYTYYVNKLCQKVGLETWIWRQIVTSQTVHIKHKWPPSAAEWKPPMEIFCVRHWLAWSGMAWFIFLFIDKQPMKAGQGWKRSLATQRLTQKKNDTHTHKCILVKFFFVGVSLFRNILWVSSQELLVLLMKYSGICSIRCGLVWSSCFVVIGWNLHGCVIILRCFLTAQSFPVLALHCFILVWHQCHVSSVRMTSQAKAGLYWFDGI